MRKVKANLEIPEDAYLALSSSGYTKKRISLEAKSLLAAHLFERGVFKPGKGSGISGVEVRGLYTFS